MTRITFLALVAATPALAQSTPHMGGPMKHMLVSFVDDDHLEIHVDQNVPRPELQDYDETYDGAAAVLNDTYYNAQYGWLVDGFWTPPQDSLLWIQEIKATPGLLTYSGGNMMAPHTFDPIFGTDDSPMSIQWDGAMLHNWYAATERGNYMAVYHLYFGDEEGNPTPGYDPAEVTLTWTADMDCPADCNQDGTLDILDFVCYQQAFQTEAPLADCDFSGTWSILDFVCFQQAFVAGCP